MQQIVTGLTNAVDAVPIVALHLAVGLDSYLMAATLPTLFVDWHVPSATTVPELLPHWASLEKCSSAGVHAPEKEQAFAHWQVTVTS